MSRQQAGAFKTTNKVVVVEGTLKAEEIKSSMTLEELAMGFNASLNTLLKFLSLPQDVPGSTQAEGPGGYRRKHDNKVGTLKDEQLWISGRNGREIQQ